MLDFSQFECLTFDCYGTLIDWESGILGAIRPILETHHRKLSDDGILELYAALESEEESGEYKKYRQVLQRVMWKMAARIVFPLTEAEFNALPDSMPQWPAFPDTVEALRRLKSKYKLAIISNTDDDLFAQTAKTLQVPFDFVITAEQARSYKPSLNNFHVALETNRDSERARSALRAERVSRHCSGARARDCERLGESQSRKARLGSDARGGGEA